MGAGRRCGKECAAGIGDGLGRPRSGCAKHRTEQRSVQCALSLGPVLKIQDESLIIQDYSLMIQDKSWIIQDESLIIQDESLIIQDESLIMQGYSLIIQD